MGSLSIVQKLTIEKTPIVWRYLTPQAYLEISSATAVRPVAAIIHGNFAAPARPWPQVRSELSPLEGQACIEVFFAGAATSFEQQRNFDILSADDFMIAACRLDETGNETLTRRSERLYADLFQLIGARGYPHILRIWNIIEDINREEDGLERYRHFCLGRQEAFANHRPDLADLYPAASAIGSREGGLCVYVIAAREPGMTVENPKQVSAFRYPAQYGPRSPSFSRALVKTWNGHANLFISGTASITGHETRHAGALAAQVERTIDNLETLVAEARRKSGIPFALKNPSSVMKVYVRRPEDFALIRDIVARQFGDDVDILYLRGDICRDALLVEIDGVLSA